ncbi:hypothetical protein [Pseudomonas donghuensis]|uniref:hypothetical protein n=1 Tax=Pseudomonas donghuensis TaxID=1163398 RepID=UPI00215F6DB5|nr:hypothetical protein [Pseudomonas donghuensis]UVL24077.1 hypothetical protein LOY30_25275 [Pseudomonas donghuensis]
MAIIRSFLLLACAFYLSGCTTGDYAPMSGWEIPQMQIYGDKGYSGPAYTCKKKHGCREHCKKHDCRYKPLIFDPTKAEPSATTMHRGW